MKEMLEKSMFNYLKLHLLTHYAQQIGWFGSRPHYSMEIIEAIHKAFKDPYGWSNRVDGTLKILHTRDREDLYKMQEVNLCPWWKQLNFGSDIKDQVAVLEKDRQNSKKKTGKAACSRSVSVGQVSRGVL